MSERSFDKSKLADVIVDDLKHCILDYIYLPADLRNLSLVSTSWNSAATQRLYKQLVLIGEADSVVFDLCLNRGASKHLRHVRELSILEEWDEDTESTSVWSLLYSPESTNNKGRKCMDAVEFRLLRLLRALPDNHLHTVRLMLVEPLGRGCLEYLRVHQRNLTCLHVNTPTVSWALPSDFQELAIGFQKVYDKTQRLNDILDRLTSPEALLLAFWGGWTTEVYRHWLNWTDQTMHKVIPQQLTVLGSMPDTFWQAMSGKLDLSRLTSLALINCGFDSLRALRESIHNLVTLKICCATSLGDAQLYVLEDIFKANKELVHVHLDIHDTQLEIAPTTSFQNNVTCGQHEIPAWLKERAYLWPLRNRAKSLSLNDKNFLEQCADEDVRAGYGTRMNTFVPVLKEFVSICEYFPRLQQLAWNIFEPRTHGDMLDIIEPLSRLEDLRVFHVYQQYFALPQDKSSCDCENVISHLRHFAIQFFTRLHPHCPRLSVLAWGLCGGLSTPGGAPLGEEVNGSAPIRQHIFVKRVVVQPDGSLELSADLVSRAWVRCECPDLDLLQHDPGLSKADPGNQLLGW